MKYVKRKGEKFGRSMAWAGSKPNHTYTNRHARIHTRRLSFQAQHTNKQNTKFRLLQFFQNQQNKTKKEPSTIRRCVVFVSFSKGPNERKNINLWNLMRRIYTDNQISEQNEKKERKNCAHKCGFSYGSWSTYTGPTIRNAFHQCFFSFASSRRIFSLPVAAGGFVAYCWMCVLFSILRFSESKCFPFIRLSPFFLIWQSTNL